MLPSSWALYKNLAAGGSQLGAAGGSQLGAAGGSQLGAAGGSQLGVVHSWGVTARGCAQLSFYGVNKEQSMLL